MLLGGFTEVFKQLVDSTNGCTVPFFLFDPTPHFCIRGKREFSLSAHTQTRSVGRRGDKLCTREVQIAFARSFFRKSQTMPEFEFGLEEVALQPIDRGRT
jgi:hypothetical protein